MVTFGKVFCHRTMFCQLHWVVLIWVLNIIKIILEAAIDGNTSLTHIMFQAFFACDQIDQIVVATCSFHWHCVGHFCDTTSDSACTVNFWID